MRIDRDRVWITRTVLLLPLAVSAAVIAADHEKAKATAPDSPAQEQKATPGNPGNAKPAPSATFEPSEKIKADSSVSFPVDI